MAKPQPLESEYHIKLFGVVFMLEKEKAQINIHMIDSGIKRVMPVKNTSNLGNDLMSLGKGIKHRSIPLNFISCTKKNEGRGKGNGRKGYYSINYDGIIRYIYEHIFKRHYKEHLDFTDIKRLLKRYFNDVFMVLDDPIEYEIIKDNMVKEKRTKIIGKDLTLRKVLEDFFISASYEYSCMIGGIDLFFKSNEEFEKELNKDIPPWQVFMLDCYDYYEMKLSYTRSSARGLFKRQVNNMIAEEEC